MSPRRLGLTSSPAVWVCDANPAFFWEYADMILQTASRWNDDLTPNLVGLSVGCPFANDHMDSLWVQNVLRGVDDLDDLAGLSSPDSIGHLFQLRGATAAAYASGH
jgi:hypothetical protein